MSRFYSLFTLFSLSLSLSQSLVSSTDERRGLQRQKERMCKSNNKNIQFHSKNSTKIALFQTPARKTRTKIRKPKFLSLQRELSPESREMNHHPTANNPTTTPHPQLNLFPLHPENLFEEKDIPEHNVDYFFHDDDGGGATLNGLLGGGSSDGSVIMMSSELEEDSFLSPSSLSYAYGTQDSDEGASSSLARTALRHHHHHHHHNQERDASEERWVFYSEVVEKKEEEVSSSVVTATGAATAFQTTQGGLSLKLDYEQILNAWSDRSPFYIDGECPQTVPDITDNASLDFGCSGDGRQWRVPDDGSGGAKEMSEAVSKIKQREARVLRYREKRQSRLFSKKIRYEVRKLNAEIRPRLKGRFVKRN
ncbi:PREDICTED: zinc finger protein CONSTANS-LIKE 6 [Nelumbo nucifera]|uniref:CCT domain-containing protein n=2 Tax=Nelumbo nucifera TaxID=4432 RepID=A0A822YIG9_NELNU|nr:PREDICTED: zinc finger protein CONSTANS-LIKE 6 [Nelumbo nucifera]DAD30716.1 TPA_asm: hypothetical protein HUJ06_009567 [Nelumbo nucifera]